MQRFALKPPAMKPRYVPKIEKHEEGIQRRVASYIRQHYPHVDFFSDYASGLHLTMNQARIGRSMRSGRGWPDVFIAWPTTVTLKDGTEKHFCGLALELKRDNVAIYVTRGPRKGQLVQDEQIQIEAAVLTRLNKVGYLARFVVGYDAAVRLIDWYFGCENASLF